MSSTVQTPAQRPAPLAPAMPIAEVRITGRLERGAEVRFTAGHGDTRALLLLHITPDRGFPFVACQDCGTTPAEHMAAKAKQQQLQRGDLVTVYAQSISPRNDHGHAVLLLEGVTAVIPARTPTRHTAHPED